MPIAIVGLLARIDCGLVGRLASGRFGSRLLTCRLGSLRFGLATAGCGPAGTSDGRRGVELDVQRFVLRLHMVRLQVIRIPVIIVGTSLPSLGQSLFPTTLVRPSMGEPMAEPMRGLGYRPTIDRQCPESANRASR